MDIILPKWSDISVLVELLIAIDETSKGVIEESLIKRLFTLVWAEVRNTSKEQWFISQLATEESHYHP